MTEMTRAELRQALRPDRTEDQMPELDVQTTPTVIDEVHHWGPDKLAQARELLSEPGAARLDVAAEALDDAVLRGDGDCLMARLPKLVSREGRIFRLKSGPIRREPNGRASLRLDFQYLGRVQGEG